MLRTYSNIDKIRAELTWVNETSDPNVARTNAAAVTCAGCEETGHTTRHTGTPSPPAALRRLNSWIDPKEF